MIVSISGVPGSGKTSAAKILAQALGLKFYSIGGLRGKMALERGVTIDELNTLGESDPTTDTSVDAYQRELGRKEDGFVIEGRLSWHFIPHSFKVFLDCDPTEAARRIHGAQRAGERHDEHAQPDIDATRADLDRRIASDVRRYQKYYGVDYRDPSHYDLVLDTTSFTAPNETSDAILTTLTERGLRP